MNYNTGVVFRYLTLVIDCNIGIYIWVTLNTWCNLYEEYSQKAKKTSELNINLYDIDIDNKAKKKQTY